ncbi:MAG: benzylsuccinate synthase subunit delta, partial [Bacteroidales bacterium]|nr:benzylsuccinate synthase subunit delta [Bacteroidales bacterium]
NDTFGEKERLKELLKQFSGKISVINLLPYHSIARNKYRKAGRTNYLESLKDLPASDLQPMADELEETGVKVIIGG